MAEGVAAEKALSTVDRDRIFQFHLGGLEARAEAVEISDEEGWMAGGAVFPELAFGCEEDVELVVAAAVPDAVACSFRERVWPRHLLEAKEFLEEAAGFGDTALGDVYLHMVEAKDSHGAIIPRPTAEC